MGPFGNLEFFDPTWSAPGTHGPQGPAPGTWATGPRDDLREFVELPSSSPLARVRVVACCRPCPFAPDREDRMDCGGPGGTEDVFILFFCFATSIGLERFAISKEHSLTQIRVATFKITMF